MSDDLQISVNDHSSIRVKAGKVLRFDPFRISGTPRDADVIFITHEHFDHFSPEDISAVMKADTLFVMPETMRRAARSAGISEDRITFVKPGQTAQICGFEVSAVPAYNIGKPFHPRENNWVGYAVAAAGKRLYVCGDTDAVPEALSVKCDIIFVPIGGHFTMDAKEAAAMVSKMAPVTAVPVHYGSVAGSPGDAEVFEKNVGKGVTVLKKLFV